MKKRNSGSENFNSIIAILKELHSLYPNQGVSRHIHEATLDYRNLWSLGDKELLFALTKYKAELEMNIVDEKEVEEILQDGLNLDKNIEDLLQEDTDWDNEG